MEETNTESETTTEEKPVKETPPESMEGCAKVSLEEWAQVLAVPDVAARALLTYLMVSGKAFNAPSFKTPGKKGRGASRWFVCDDWAKPFARFE